MLKTNLDMGNGTILKDVRVWEVKDGMPKIRNLEFHKGLASNNSNNIDTQISNWACVELWGIAVDKFEDEEAYSWEYFIPLTEIVEAAMRMGKASGYITGYNVFCNYEGGGGPFFDDDHLKESAEKYANNPD